MTQHNAAPLPSLSGAEGFNHSGSEAPAYWWLDILWIVLADAKDTGCRFSRIEELLPRGSGPGSHKHIWSNETYYILDSDITFLVGDEIKVAHKGDFLRVPRDTRHAFRVDSETAWFLNGSTPASLEAAVTELAMPAPERVLPPKGLSPMPTMTPEQLRCYGIDLVPGPDPLRPRGH